MPKYFIAELTKLGWRRISNNFMNLKEAQSKHKSMKYKYPNTCVVVANEKRVADALR